MRKRFNDFLNRTIRPIFEAVFYWLASRSEREQLLLLMVGAVLPPLAALIVPRIAVFPIVLMAVFPFFIIVGACLGGMARIAQRELLLRTTSTMDELRRLGWRDFEYLVAALLEAEGWKVHHTGRDEPDGGVDVTAVRDRKKWIIQCKRWDREQVGVNAIRELKGLTSRNDAHGVMLFTIGEFSRPAWKEFEDDECVVMVEGGEVLRRLETIRRSLNLSPEHDIRAANEFLKSIANFMKQNPAFVHVPKCEHCGKRMTLAYSAKTRQRFWGCSGYNSGTCMSSRPLEEKDIAILDSERIS